MTFTPPNRCALMTKDEIEEADKICRSLTNITPDGRGIIAIETLRSTAATFVADIVRTQPPSRERSLALTHLEETVMWAVKGVVLNGAKELQ